MIRTILFEDSKNFRESLSLYLAGTENIFLTGTYPDAKDAVKIVKQQKPDVILMDIEMPGISGIQATIDIKKALPEAKILIQTVFEDDDKVFQALCNGANGYILKSPDPEQYVRAIQEVHEGGSHLTPSIAAKVLNVFKNQLVQSQKSYIELTPREKDVLGCLVEGMSYKMIADSCGISYTTVNSHMKHIYEKLHVNSAPEAVAKAIKLRLV
ncbi:response regulator transcription factor [Marinilongibacter aquaticus]|uniref:response regulator transcription factor n=1 Tax=Marinilongibacter aquaticus TaxID=2975157 RepID=UPI0021BDB893|nr:response regulator transcription factor [Marinilongibacter aquaticus]UBM60905.1 response regulator transcription factor [Marinilongibacter aquaticus]